MSRFNAKISVIELSDGDANELFGKKFKASRRYNTGRERAFELYSIAREIARNRIADGYNCIITIDSKLGSVLCDNRNLNALTGCCHLNTSTSQEV